MRVPRLLAPSLLLPLLLTLACGPEEGSGLKLKEGQSLPQGYACGGDGSCFYVYDVCVSVKYDEYRLPAMCLPGDVCNRFTCAEGECRVYTGVPGEVKCVMP